MPTTQNNSFDDIVIGLIHHPVYDKNKKIITTAVTNLDIHDLARTALVYDIKSFYLITPLKSQQELVVSIQRHWCKGAGAVYNPLRKEALERIKIAAELSEVIESLQANGSGKVATVATTARSLGRAVDYIEMQKIIATTGGQFFILFGTGWGLTDEIIESCDYVLKPISGMSATYNHLPVRAAAAIVLDRIFGRKADG